MKKATKRLFSLVLASVMMFGFAISGFAAGQVTYTSKDKSFTLAPGTEYSDTDLFDEMRDMMPGDKIDQTVRFVYNGKSGVTAKVYLKAVIPADETGELGEFVHIASLRKGDETDLTVTAKLSLEADNEFRDKAAKIQWIFKIEEIPDPPYVPDTSDNTGVMLYAGMFGVAAISLIVLFVFKRKKSEE